MSNENQITLNNIVFIKKDSIPPISTPETGLWEIGQDYHIETVNKYFTGTLVAIDATDFALANACWIQSTGEFSDYVSGSNPKYAEPYTSEQILLVSRRAYVSAVKRSRVTQLIGR